MADSSLTLLIPALVLTLVGWLVPRMLFHVFPEGVRPLLTLAVTATVIMLCFGMAFFAVLYIAQGLPFSALFHDGAGSAVTHFLRLGLISSLLWGPMMLLSVAGLPKRWQKEVW